jgi:hypothetical protein
MTFRPVWLREQIVDEVDAAAVQERECSIKMRELARPGVRINQVEPLCCALEKCTRVSPVKSDSIVVSD